MAFEFDPLTGRIQDVDPRLQVPEVVQPPVEDIIQTHYQDALQVAVQDEDGQLYYVPKQNAKAAMSEGYKLVTPNEIDELLNEQEFGDSPLTAGLLGAMSGVSFGLSNVAARAMGYEDEVREYMNRNPGAWATGDVAGAVGSLFVPLGWGGLVARGATKGAAMMGAKGLSKALAIGAIEGAATGVQQTITEQALGSNKGISESLISNVGQGALYGGAFSGIFHAGIAGAKRGAKGVGALMKGTPVAEATLDDFVRPVTAQQQALDDEFQAAADALGINPTQAMKTRSPIMRKMEAFLRESPLFGSGIRKQRQEMYDTAQAVVSDAFDEITQSTAAEMGDELKTRFIRDLQHRYDSTQKIYQQLADMTEGMMVPTKNRKGTISALKRAIRNEPLGSKVQKRVERIMDQLGVDELSSDTLDLIIKQNRADIRKYFRSGETEIAQGISRATKSLENLQERAILRNAMDMVEGNALFIPKELKQSLGKLTGEEIIAQRKWAKQEYRQFYEFMEEMTGELKFGKIKTPSQFMAAIDDLDSEKIMQKLVSTTKGGTKGRASGISFLQQNFPDIMEKVGKFEKARILDLAQDTVEGNPTLNVKRVIKEVDKMSPEAQQAVFGREAMESFENLKKVIKRDPDILNPSRTADSTRMLFFLEPMFIKGEASVYATYKALPMIQKATRRTAANLDKAAIYAMMPTSEKIASAAGRLGSHAVINMTRDEIKTSMEKITEAAGRPEMWVETIGPKIQNVANIDPEVHQELINHSFNSIQFLNSKVPKEMQQYALDNDDYYPSDMETTKFARYLRAVDNPMSVLEDIKKGTLTEESLEVLEVLYPTLLQQLRERIIEKSAPKAKQKKLDFQAKLTLSQIMGQPMSKYSDPAFIGRMQENIGNMVSEDAIQQQQQSGKGVKVDIAGNVETESQRVSQR